MFQQRSLLQSAVRRTAGAAMIASTIAICHCLAATASTYYVSKNGNNKDGTSWASAWNEMNQIKWSTVKGGDTILLDGGTKSLTYKTALAIPTATTHASATTIALATESGRNGQVIIDGTGTGAAIGISVLRPVNILGNKWHGIVVQGFPAIGILVNSPLNVPTISGVDVIGTSSKPGLLPVLTSIGVDCITACTLQYATVGAYAHNVVIASNRENQSSYLNYCWIYNPNQALTGSNGVEFNYPVPISPGVTTNGCVFGPGLTTALNMEGGSLGAGATAGAVYCLFEDASQNNILQGQYSSLYLNYCTSFMTHLNANGKSHSCLDLDAKNLYPYPTTVANNSIFYGGSVIALVGTHINPGPAANFQYQTTGNTTFLGTSETNPQFLTDLTQIPNNVTFTAMSKTDFTLKSNSPALGSGSSPRPGTGISSVSNLLSQPYSN